MRFRLAAPLVLLLCAVPVRAQEQAPAGFGAEEPEEDEGPPLPDRGASAVRGLLAMVVVVVGITGFAHLLEKKLRKEVAAGPRLREFGPPGRIPPPPVAPPRREPPPVAGPQPPRRGGG